MHSVCHITVFLLKTEKLYDGEKLNTTLIQPTVQLLPRNAMLARCILWLCLSLCLSVTAGIVPIMAKHRITQATPHDSPRTLVF